MASKKTAKKTGLPTPKKNRKRSESKQKKFMHKEAVCMKETGESLEDLLKNALKKLKTVSKRMLDRDSQGERCFLNYHLPHSTENGAIYGGEFLQFESGADQNVIEIAEDVEELNVDAIPAGEDKEFVGGSVYFGVKGNHVVLFQSHALRAPDLERYLNWLIITKAKLLDAENYIQLRDHISKRTAQQLKGVKGIRLKSPLMPSVDISPVIDSGKGIQKSESFRIKPKGPIFQSLKAFLGDGFDLPKDFSEKDLMSIPDLEIVLYLHWKGRHGENENDFLNKVATELRHVGDDELDYEIEAKHGKMSKKEIKLEKSFSVSWGESGRPKFDELFPKMTGWLESLVLDGKLDP